MQEMGLILSILTMDLAKSALWTPIPTLSYPELKGLLTAPRFSFQPNLPPCAHGPGNVCQDNSTSESPLWSAPTLMKNLLAQKVNSSKLRGNISSLLGVTSAQ